MISGIISLTEIYAFVRSGNSQKAIDGSSTLGRQFGKICSKVVNDLPDDKGFYLWGRYVRRFWHNIYLGKAGFKKTAHLRNRILEELKDERCCFWRLKHTENELQKLREDSYPGKYEKEWKRSLLKAGATHIVYVSYPEINEEQVEKVESDLIESMNPVANVKRPIPPASLNSHTAIIFHQFRECIHQGRNSAFNITLK